MGGGGGGNTGHGTIYIYIIYIQYMSESHRGHFFMTFVVLRKQDT